MQDNIHQLPVKAHTPAPSGAAGLVESGLRAHQQSLQYAFEHINAATQCLQDAGIAAPAGETTSQICAAMAMATTLGILVGRLGGAE